MPNTDVRDRFVIALAKFLGESPRPLSSVLVCEEWFLSELLNPILPDGNRVILTLERFNQLMLACGRRLASPHFYKYFFQTVDNIEGFEESVENFRIKAMWLFGNFKFAYKRLAPATISEAKFDALVRRTEPKTTAEFDGREKFTDIETIPEEDLSFLGYVSLSRLNDLEMTVGTLKMLSAAKANWAGILQLLGSDNQRRMSQALARESVDFPPEGTDGITQEKLDSIIAKVEPELRSRRTRQVEAQQIGVRNTQRYLSLPYLDVYVATSMRSESDFLAQYRFLQSVFGRPEVSDLNLRYFDPTMSYDHDRIKKGLIECLMLRRAKVTIYLAGAEDTMGKDSELAATLAQGKPVIVYVAADPRFVPVEGRVEPVDMDKRAKTFQVDHPLGLQIDAQTGVTHGIVVVRTIEACAKMLRKVLLHDLKLSIKHVGGNFLLEEEETKSILRVVTDDASLSHSFWAYFKHTEPEPDI